MRGIASLLLMGIASTALAASPPTFDTFQSSVENKVAPPEGTFFNTGKFKSLCSCMDATGYVGVIESTTAVVAGNDVVASVCVVSTFNPSTKAIANQALCSPWAPITKP